MIGCVNLIVYLCTAFNFNDTRRLTFSPPSYIVCSREYPSHHGFPTPMHPPCLLHPLSFSLSIVDLASPSGVAPTRQDTRGTPGDSMDELFTRLCRSVKVSHPARLQGHAALLTCITTKRKRRFSRSPYLRLAKRVLFTSLLWWITTRRYPKADNSRRLSSIYFTMPFTVFERWYYGSTVINLDTRIHMSFCIFKHL